jgi:hypothetical protein
MVFGVFSFDSTCYATHTGRLLKKATNPSKEAAKIEKPKMHFIPLRLIRQQ